MVTKRMIGVNVSLLLANQVLTYCLSGSDLLVIEAFFVEIEISVTTYLLNFQFIHELGNIGNFVTFDTQGFQYHCITLPN